jgi:hypothetical protein
MNRAEPAMTKTVLVTGAAGFVGSRLVNPLFATHAHVRPQEGPHCLRPRKAWFRRVQSGDSQPAVRCA